MGDEALHGVWVELDPKESFEPVCSCFVQGLGVSGFMLLLISKNLNNEG